MFSADFDNPWVLDVRTSGRRTSAFAVAIVASALAAVILVGAGHWAPFVEASLSGALGALSDNWRDALAGGVLVIVVFGLLMAIAVLAARWEGRRVWRREPFGPGPALAGGLAFGFGGFCASAALASVAGAIGMGGEHPFSSPIGLLVVGLALTAFQSAAEESYFRGWLQPVLCAGWGPWLGLLAASALFAGLHVIASGHAHSPIALINLLLAGMLFGLLALRSGGLVASAAAHFAWNWTESGVLGLESAPTGRMIDLKLRGAALWSGGADTMNGSLATTIVLASLFLTLLTIKGAPQTARA